MPSTSPTESPVKSTYSPSKSFEQSHQVYERPTLQALSHQNTPVLTPDDHWMTVVLPHLQPNKLSFEDSNNRIIVVRSHVQSDKFSCEDSNNRIAVILSQIQPQLQ